MSSALTPRPRSARVRLGIGAGLVLLLLAGGVAAAAAALTPGGATTVLAPASGSASPSAGTTDESGSGSDASGTGGAGDGGDAAAGSDAGGSSRIYVHVTGQVAHPGLFRLAPGSRVVDAVGAAGGLTAQADAAAINLARALDDGEQLHVPAVGEAAAAGVGGTGAVGGASGSSVGASAGSGSAAGGAGGTKININTADQTALETLPRVGPALAQRILAWRQQNGRFASIEDLRDVSGIGEKTFEQLQPLVTV
ncbi:ComEA family DNA-binding protein [Schumannella soli]|uniref:ComEA family DNA-binding protein n=1 Tax=Schumannella soli TaxID=2590779 RepID=A0A506Y257_9MICO|nr:ComEA family DNA-binding protein [Schumannella soli]TPW74489.1 ComEA family DNA-binding protein [Schumannella soli]